MNVKKRKIKIDVSLNKFFLYVLCCNVFVIKYAIFWKYQRVINLNTMKNRKK